MEPGTGDANYPIEKSCYDQAVERISGRQKSFYHAQKVKLELTI